ncbi:MAG TPA: DNA-3-methyladenine glycosylase [Candidatus Moranbacteria bacterium]|jgi:DNA-3-methyladenine glycosylase|nr:DNA-3-methyladenine glycosylase [Candidatus Moranbacteria bacterium]HPX94053.1 DNA-3-methyladenine glycosylase [Candidatus Moranbacteria bacterium]HQB59775.1 DNA-3-methyladenine glycosylase [Candidatus Moranbacteria bacterium]
MSILKREFYSRNTLDVARDLLGCFLVRKIGNKIIKAVITETEAYIGEDDLACHASKGRTPRTEIMYSSSGHAYIYMIYGMYHCLNFVTERKNYPAAVLIRSVIVDGVEYRKANGPGKLCKFLRIDRKLNGLDITKKEKLWVETGWKISEGSIKSGKRIGIDYAKHCREYLWRFTLADKKWR